MAHELSIIALTSHEFSALERSLKHQRRLEVLLLNHDGRN